MTADLPANLIPGAEPTFFEGGPAGALVLHGFTGNPGSMRVLAERLAAAGYYALVVPAEVAALIGVGVDTIEKWRAAGDGPPWRKFGRTIGGSASRARTLPRYRRAEVLAWIEAKRQAGGAC